MDKLQNRNQSEKKWYKFWENNGFFKADPNSAKTPYSLLIPPPNLTGSPHLGHAMQHAILDAIARFKRMQGFDVLLLPGVDHAGIQFEGTLNKLLEKEGTSKYKLGREAWLKRAWQLKDEVYKDFHDTWTVFGLSADWSREVFTLEPKVQKAVLEEFKTFWESDLLYKGAYIVQWCPKDQTAIEDLEMEYEEKKEKLYYVKYAVVGNDGEFITIATARPETIFADTGIAVYPKHPKYSKYVGKEARNPLTQGGVKIIEDDRVDKGFGTGAVKMTPGHDPLDFAIGKDHGLPLIHAIDKTGRMTNIAKITLEDGTSEDLTGLKAAEAREKAIATLEKVGAIEKAEDYIHSVPVCERCKTTIEPLVSEEWFVKMKPLAENALKHLSKINFVPKNYQKILGDWLREIHDWSISRSLWWGHRIPVWYCQKCNPNHEVGKNKDMVISLDEPGKNCQSCNQKHWVQDEQVLDTWFSSGLWPMATLGWPASQGEPKKTRELQRYYPWDFELSAPEIKFLWIARMIMLGFHFTGEIPFKNMFFHGMIRDLQGRKFSKSLGNGIDPKDLQSAWGTDATRMALYSYSAPGRDAKTSRQVMDERCKNYRNFSTKLKNLTRFIIDLKPQDTSSPDKHITAVQDLSEENQQIIQYLNGTIDKVTRYLENYQLHLAIDELYDFVWHKFADSFVESSKKRRAEAQPVLEYVFKTSLELLHPFMPYITEELWQKLPHEEKSIMLAKWPKTS